MKNTNFSNACREISQSLLQITEPTKNHAKTEIKRICTKYSLDKIPKNYEILSTVDGKSYEKLQKILLKKPVKTASGVAVIALMPKPYACPHGRCTYCPGGIEFNTPNSYTGKEPVTISSIKNGYDANIQITSKLNQLHIFGHDTTKIELVVVGGTFLFMPKDYQENFIKSCYDALNGFPSPNLEIAMENNQKTKNRNVGFTIETKPDYCKKEHVDLMLSYGVTRVEIGVQSLHERVYKIVNRGHDYNDVIESFQISKDSGYKIVAHMMPGLPTMTPNEDVNDFKKLFNDSNLKPDMLKIYPSLVLKNTPLYNDYLEKKYKPKFIIDLATLTGAIIISLGEEYAGLFSNNDELSKNIFKSSENVNEKVWRLPLHKNYDKLMNSTIADVQNINYVGGAGSITAAQFLQRFILNKTPWAHLDIAGMAFSKKAANLNPGGATGFGVRLLNYLVKEYYE